MTDYISREYVLKCMEDSYKNAGISAEAKAKITRWLNKAPAADVRPVVRGKWKSDGDGYHWTYNCSICGWKDGYPFNERHKFCPNCGAWMEES